MGWHGTQTSWGQTWQASSDGSPDAAQDRSFSVVPRGRGCPGSSGSTPLLGRPHRWATATNCWAICISVKQTWSTMHTPLHHNSHFRRRRTVNHVHRTPLDTVRGYHAFKRSHACSSQQTKKPQWKCFETFLCLTLLSLPLYRLWIDTAIECMQKFEMLFQCSFTISIYGNQTAHTENSINVILVSLIKFF